MKKPKSWGLGAVEPNVVKGTLDENGVLVADGVYYRDANGKLKRETPYDIPLRDFFAGCALVGVLSSIDCGMGWSMEMLSEDAFRQADAMLKAREVEDE